MIPIRHPLFFIRQFIKNAAWVKRITLCTGLVLSITITQGQQVKMYTGCNLVINGNIYVVLNNTAFDNSGTFTAGSGTVKFTGNTDTSIAYLCGSSSTTFNNLSITKSAYGVALKSAAIVKNILTVDAGNLYTDSNLTLRSDVNLTARVAPVAATSYIIGKANVERYFPARRAWRLLTAPVTNSNTIYCSWQNSGVYTTGLGMLVTGPGPTGGAGNGLDPSAQNNVSMKGWNYSTQAFAPVVNSKVSISPGSSGSADNAGYFTFVRGDRNPINTIIGNTNITTINSIGSLQTGTQTFPASSVAAKYTLIGNPYPSPIDFNNVVRTNLIKRFYAWDATLNIVGGYVMLDDLDGNGVYDKTIPASTQTKDIQSSQAFFVETLAAGAADITFSESSKSGYNNNMMFRPATGNTPAGTASGKIWATLNLLNADNTTITADGTFAEFNNIFSAAVDLDDALKFGNINENLSIVRNNISLTAERRPALGLNDTIFFKLATTTQRSYQFVFDAINLDQPGITGYLEDNYSGTKKIISLSGATIVNFFINADAASAATNRFKIVFKQALSTLPVTISSVKAYQQNNNIAVEWTVENELNMEKYDVEKSTGGIVFATANTTKVTGVNNAYNHYSWLDINAAPGNNFYRIKSYGTYGEIKYSAVVQVNMERKISHFTVQPNPVNGTSIHLHFANQPAGNYQFDLINTAGQLVWSNKVFISRSNTAKVLKTGTVFPAGVYQLQITGTANTMETQKVMIQQ